MTENVGPIDASVNPRYSGIATFARLPRIEDVPVSYTHLTLPTILLV